MVALTEEREITEAEKAAYAEQWINGEILMKDIAEITGFHLTTVRLWARAGKWQERKKALRLGIKWDKPELTPLNGNEVVPTDTVFAQEQSRGYLKTAPVLRRIMDRLELDALDDALTPRERVAASGAYCNVHMRLQQVVRAPGAPAAEKLPPRRPAKSVVDIQPI